VTALDEPFTFPVKDLRISSAKGKSIALPAWTEFLISLTKTLNADVSSVPLTFVATLPTRSFAAVFVALGIVQSRRLVSGIKTGQFDEVWRMTGSVSVRYLWDGRAIGGTVVDRTERLGIRYLHIAGKGSAITWLPEKLAQHLVIQQDGGPKRSRPLEISDPWLARMLVGCDPEQYLFNDRYDCLIVGQDNFLQREAKLELLLLNEIRNTPSLSGTIDSVLRVKRWQAPGKAFSSDVLPSSSDHDEVDLEHLRRFPYIIFDGSSGYLRWQHLFRNQHHLVLLSRTDRKLDEAVTVLEKAFMNREGDSQITVTSPPGLETITFQRQP
jgi:hypothetical protein